MSEDQQIPIYDAQEPSEESKQLVTLFYDLESRQLDFDLRRTVVIFERQREKVARDLHGTHAGGKRQPGQLCNFGPDLAGISVKRIAPYQDQVKRTFDS